MGSRVYLDTNLYIYLFEGPEEYRRSMMDLTAEIDRLDVAVIASELIFTELLPRPVRDGGHELVEAYLKLMQRTPRITLVPVDRRVILRAVDLRANFGLRVDGPTACSRRARARLRDIPDQRRTFKRRKPDLCADAARVRRNQGPAKLEPTLMTHAQEVD